MVRSIAAASFKSECAWVEERKYALMKCPSSGAAGLVRETRDLPYLHNGVTTLIPAVNGDYCPACNEVVLDKESGDRYSALIGKARREQGPSSPGGS